MERVSIGPLVRYCVSPFGGHVLDKTFIGKSDASCNHKNLKILKIQNL